MDKNKTKLIKDIEKRCTTIMIGSLARFEENFGYLWERSGQQADMFDRMWEDTRNNILNFGNHQIRSVVEQLYEHFLQEKQTGKYHYQLYMKDKQQEGDKP